MHARPRVPLTPLRTTTRARATINRPFHRMLGDSADRFVQTSNEPGYTRLIRHEGANRLLEVQNLSQGLTKDRDRCVRPTTIYIPMAKPSPTVISPHRSTTLELERKFRGPLSNSARRSAGPSPHDGVFFSARDRLRLRANSYAVSAAFRGRSSVDRSVAHRSDRASEIRPNCRRIALSRAWPQTTVGVILTKSAPTSPIPADSYLPRTAPNMQQRGEIEFDQSS